MFTRLYSTEFCCVPQLLCELSKDGDRLHPDFRMWLLLPFDAVDSGLSVDCIKVAFDYIDISGPQVCDIKFVQALVCIM